MEGLSFFVLAAPIVARETRGCNLQPRCQTPLHPEKKNHSAKSNKDGYANDSNEIATSGG